MYNSENRAIGDKATGMDTPDCVATYEAGHSDCDGVSRGSACKLRKRCIELTRFARAEKIEPQKLASALSLKEIKAFCAGRLELQVNNTRGGGQSLHKLVKKKSAPKSLPIFRKVHWKLYHVFERTVVENFQPHRVVNCLTTKAMTKVRVPDKWKGVLRKGALYPIVKASGEDIVRVIWCYANSYQNDTHLVKISPLNKTTRLHIQMVFPIAELELRAAPELISELGLKITGRGLGRQTSFIVRTASARLIKLSVYALKIMIDSGYLGVPEFGALSAEGG